MKPVLLTDIGSTYTKVTAVDVSRPGLLGSAAAYTTVETNVGEGFSAAISELEKQTGPLLYHKRIACSSAAGGLRMVACGLAPELTAKAAKMATLGAGAKIVGLYAYQLTEDDVAEISRNCPDILLLTGGADGGNTACILHNAEMLANSTGDYPIVVAGNRSCGRQVMKILENRRAYLCDNVMPEIDKLNVVPAQQKIRDIFLSQIVKAKGLDSIAGLTDGVLMPTPAAVLAAMELLAAGCEGEEGIGDLMAVDVGGATTDVYSIAEGAPDGVSVLYKGLQEPFAKRTVEGDIGMRRSVRGIVEAAGIARVAELSGLCEAKTLEIVDWLCKNPDALPKNDELASLEFALAALAIETATLRHAGELEEVYTATGRVFVQTGKNLTGLRRIVLTGGTLIHSERQSELAAFAGACETMPFSLRPKQAQTLVDKRYILAAMGLLKEYAPRAALRIMKEEL